jgi:3',5'-cyclic AMP phosphodiesterase CpdA
MATFSWIHFSDLHWSKETKNYWINKSQLLYKDIMDFKTKDSLDFNAVFVTGDLVRNGNADEYELLKTEWLNPLADEFSKMNSYPKLFIVPGNHDLKRPNSNKILQIIGNDWDEKFWEAQNQDSRTLKSIKSLFQNYNDWWKKSERRMPKVANPEIGFLPGDFAYTFTLDEDCSIGIIGLNTAFLDLKDGCNGKLEVGIKQTKTLCGGEDLKKSHKTSKKNYTPSH